MALGTKCYLPDYTKVVDGVLINASDWIDLLGISALSVHYDSTTLLPATGSITPTLYGRNCDDGDGVYLASGTAWSLGTSGLNNFTQTQIKGVRFVKLISAGETTLTGSTGAFRVHIFGQ